MQTLLLKPVASFEIDTHVHKWIKNTVWYILVNSLWNRLSFHTYTKCEGDVRSSFLFVMSLQLAPDQGLQPADQPTDLRRRCEEEAQEIVRQANSSTTGQLCVESENLTDLIARLTAILLQIKVKYSQKYSFSHKIHSIKALSVSLCPTVRTLFVFFSYSV